MLGILFKGIGRWSMLLFSLSSYAIVFRRVALEGNTTPLKTTTWEAILLLGSKRTSLQGALLVWWGIQNLLILWLNAKELRAIAHAMFYRMLLFRVSLRDMHKL